jgi:hypothetical protein
MNTHLIILQSIFPVIFNAVFFLLGGIDRNASVWVSYGFIHFAYFMLLLTPKLIPAGRNSAVLGNPLYAISAVYFLVEFLIGVIFILLSLNGYKAALLLQLSIAGFYGFVLISNLMANKYTVEAVAKREEEIAFVKNASAKLNGLLESVGDKEAKKQIERVYDVVCSSPVKSHPDLEELERKILASIDILENGIAAGNGNSITDLARSLESLVNERNRRLKTCN